MILTRKIQIYPDATAREKLWKVSHLCKDVVNACIEQRRDVNSWGKIGKYSQKKELPELKKVFPEFKLPSSQVLQNAVLSVDRSYQMFFTKLKQGDKEVRPPKFRSYRYFFTQEYSQRGSSFDLSEPGYLMLSYGKSRKDWIEVEVPKLSFGLIQTVKIQQDKSNKKWFACLTYKVEEAEKISGHRLYFDPGCKTSLTGLKTTGEFFEYDFNPLKSLNLSSYRYIDELTSRKDKIKSKKSKARRRLDKRIQKAFGKIKTRTKTYLHTLANRILQDHPDVESFKVGDWDKRKTLANTGFKMVNQKINRAVQNNNPLGKLIEILTYKAKLRGQEVKKFDERGSTRTCSLCDHVHSKGIPPSKREFRCEKCQFSYPRDQHSCLNFLKRYESAVWRRLSIYQMGSRRLELAPFSFKSQVAFYKAKLQAS